MERFFMERLKYIVEDSTIAELLGVRTLPIKNLRYLNLLKMLTMRKQTMLASLFLIVALSLLMTVLV